MRMTQLSADLAIIGSGSGNSLITPFWDDRRVVMAERGVFGGTCLNVGCIPTKMFVRPALIARAPEEAERLNVTQHTESVDWPAMRDRIFGRIDPISSGGRDYRLGLDNVELIEQRVRLTGPRSFVADDGTHMEAEQLVIAAGSRAVLPDVPGIDLPQVHTSDTVMRLDDLPGRVLVVGGGFIACEFAGIFSGLGSNVVQINRSQRLMRTLDAEVSDAFTKEAAQQWSVQLGRVLAGVREGDHGRVLADISVIDGEGNTVDREALEVDVVLVAMGRRPNSDLVDAAAAGLDLHDDGRIAVDEFQRVLSGGEAVPGLFALGDICSAAQLKHVANHEARVVAHNLEHPDDLVASRREAIPLAVFTHPELATVGLTEEAAIEALGAEHVTAKTQRYGDTAYGWAMEDGSSIFKVVADRRDGRVLGAHVMGPEASNLVQPIIAAMSFGIDAHTFARGQYWIHPALMEVAENALLGLDVPSSRVPGAI
ncbi:mycothione reductase [Leucobacter sp. Psy1]|nr:mycothione reductase [Leucobacter sp. Psy1]